MNQSVTIYINPFVKDHNDTDPVADYRNDFCNIQVNEDRGKVNRVLNSVSKF